MTATADRIQTLWEWCRSAYLRHGHRLALPRNTDPTKTYQWRFLEALQRKFSEWDFDELLCRRFIDVAVTYANERKLMRKGLSIFFQHNLLQVCYDRMREEVARHTSVLGVLANTRAWLVAQADDRPLVGVLLGRGGLGSYTNLTKWYQAGHITDLYLALSRACGLALIHLDRTDMQERQLLPRSTALILVKTPILRDPALKAEAKSILQEDWRMCQ